jgi:hypothetical protein
MESPLDIAGDADVMPVRIGVTAEDVDEALVGHAVDDACSEPERVGNVQAAIWAAASSSSQLLRTLVETSLRKVGGPPSLPA